MPSLWAKAELKPTAFCVSGIEKQYVPFEENNTHPVYRNYNGVCIILGAV